MDELDIIIKSMYTMLIFMFLVVFSLPFWGVTRNLGQTQVVGYVVNVEQASFPWEHTKVTFTIEHPTSIVDADYFTRTYYGHHTFELHQRYRITADKVLFEWYPRITEVEQFE